VVTRAGLSANSYVLAFLLPLSLLAATIFTSIRIADKLDQDYLEEVQNTSIFSLLLNGLSWFHVLVSF
jgi:hypothetical protein